MPELVVQAPVATVAEASEASAAEGWVVEVVEAFVALDLPFYYTKKLKKRYINVFFLF